MRPNSHICSCRLVHSDRNLLSFSPHLHHRSVQVASTVPIHNRAPTAQAFLVSVQRSTMMMLLWLVPLIAQLALLPTRVLAQELLSFDGVRPTSKQFQWKWKNEVSFSRRDVSEQLSSYLDPGYPIFAPVLPEVGNRGSALGSCQERHPRRTPVLHDVLPHWRNASYDIHWQRSQESVLGSYPCTKCVHIQPPCQMAHETKSSSQRPNSCSPSSTPPAATVASLPSSSKSQVR